MGAGKQPRASQVMNEVAVATPTPREGQEGDSQQTLLERLKHMPARHPAGREALHFHCDSPASAFHWETQGQDD